MQTYIKYSYLRNQYCEWLNKRTKSRFTWLRADWNEFWR